MKKTLRTCLLAVAMVSAIILGGTAPAWAVTTTALISCHKNADSSYPLGKHIHFNGSGIQYPKNTQIEVIWQYSRDGAYFASNSTTIYTTGSGSWSVPSEIRGGLGSHNKYSVEMWIYGVVSDKLIGYDYGECYMVPPAKRGNSTNAQQLAPALTS
jgi:hypothetical protein